MKNKKIDNNDNIYNSRENSININIEEISKDLNSINNIEDQEDDSPKILSIDTTSKFDICFKIIIIGNCGVGKSCLTNRIMKSKFEEGYISTIGLEYYSMFVKINNKIIKLQIWDTCGQEIYRSLITNYYRNSSMAIIVYAINNEESFQDIDLWVKELKAMSSPDIKIVLIGNKRDLIEERKILYKKGKELADYYGFDYFLETSAKSGENVKLMFIKAARLLYEEYLRYEDINSAKLSAFSFDPTKSSSLKANINKRKNNTCCQ